ncbi:Cellulose/chitin-binding protein [Gracilaria domingensis]|nr:Cellulose/chitin-binding protein [Gracilaria domingensis]
MMCTPRQRGAYHTDKCEYNMDIPDIENMVIDYCPHCLNGGGKGTVVSNLPSKGWSVYEPTKNFFGTAGRSGLCGDAKGSNDHMLGGQFMPYNGVPKVARWKKGQQVDFSAEIDTNHNGYFEFFLCNLDACGKPDLDASCFTNNHCVKLNRVPHPSCENPSEATIHECGPIDAAYPGRWYVPCRKTDHVGVHIVGGDSGTMRYQLPADMECKHCIVQWYWATANTCAPRGFKEYFVNYNFPFGTICDSDGGASGTYRADMVDCGGTASTTIPEEFWSCADVQIGADGSDAGSVPAPTASEPVSVPVEVPKRETNNDGEQRSPNTAQNGEQDKTMAASDESGDLKKAELVDVREGGQNPPNCVSVEKPCDGRLPCCDAQGVCVYRSASEGFRCLFWWSLAPQS